MTEKERLKMDTVKEKGKRTKYEMQGKIVGKEIAKYLSKKGYDVTKKNFKIHTMGCKTSPHLQFIVNDEVVAKYNYFHTEAKHDWYENDLTLFQTLKKNNEFARGNGTQNGCTFKDFLKSVKTYCKENGMYHDVEKDLEEK